MWSWQNTRTFYHSHCKNNKDFLARLNEIPLTGYDDNSLKAGPHTNSDLVLDGARLEQCLKTGEPHSLIEKYKNNKLVALRSGCVEASLFLEKRTNIDPKTHLRDRGSYAMQANAGLYWRNRSDKNFIEKWWCDNYEELLTDDNTELLSCLCFLNFDLPVWSKLALRKTYYNYAYLTRLVLQNSEGKKVLYIGNATKSIQKAFDLGTDKMWKFPVSNFSLYCLQTPQTTIGCDYPHSHMKETVETLIAEIKEKHNDFDTAVLGCGAYGAPIMNYLRRIYPNKNLIYLGAECFKMFGVYSEGMPYTYYFDAVKENWIGVVEKRPPGTENHPEPKYWKKN